jgi:hypothetical protein
MDNLLDAVATPLAVAAGTIAAAVMSDVSPFMKWSLALLTGGGMAGAVQTGTALVRGVSTVAAGGLTNIVLSPWSLPGWLSSPSSLFVPVAAFTAAIIIVAGIAWKLRPRRTGAS